MFQHLNINFGAGANSHCGLALNTRNRFSSGNRRAEQGFEAL